MTRRIQIAVGILVALVTANAVAGAGTPTEQPVTPAAAIRSFWKPALGDAGPATADRLILRHTPPCLTFESVADLAREVRGLRVTMLEQLKLDPRLPARSARLQRTLSRPGYTIEVIRLEAVPGVFLPINLYLPDNAKSHTSPLVISATGCGSATWSEHVQKRAANLALLGMTVLVTEGFCDNGVRAVLPDGTKPSPQVGYARQLIGLPGEPFGIYLQELMTAIGWTVRTHETIDPKRIGAAGYSYGGQIALYLAQVDRRVRTLSIPATYLGDDCDDPRPLSDIKLEARKPDFVWGAPPELPVLPVNSRLAMLYPRPLHTISGSVDPGAPPQVIGPAMSYVAELYALGGHEERIRYQAQGGDHHYGKRRREESYGWLTHTLLGEGLGPVAEQPVSLLDRDELAVDIVGTRTMAGELKAAADRERDGRFQRRQPTGDVAKRVTAALSELFPSFTQERLVSEDAWFAEAAGIQVRARIYRASNHAFPVFIFERNDGPPGKTLLYLPRQGTHDELETILELLETRKRVVSIDYLGIGELKSDRLLTHTFARYFMHHDPSLPRMNVELLRNYLVAAGPSAVDLRAEGWSASFYALLLTVLEPERIAAVELSGVPEDELEWVGAARPIPALLLWGGLFSKITATELGAVVARDHRVNWIR